jgi:hypothetical protein
MRAPGAYYLLLPKSSTPVAAKKEPVLAGRPEGIDSSSGSL